MLLGLALCAPAMASPVELHGFGAKAVGRADSGVAIADDVGASFLNPAGLTQLERSQALFGFALVRYRFLALPDVHWDTNRDGILDDTDPPLEVGPEYDPADSVSVAWGLPVGERMGVGLSAIMPKDRLIRINTFEPAIPTYFMYSNRPQRYAMGLGFGWEQFPGVSIGGGVRILPKVKLSMSLTLDAIVSGASDDPGGVEDLVSATVDLHDITMDIVPAVVPVLAGHWDVGQLVPALDGLSLGGMYRGASGLPIEVALDAQVNAHVQDIGDLEPTVLAAIAEATLLLYDHYLPAQIHGGAAWTFWDTWTLSADAKRTAWGNMILSVAHVDGADLTAPLVDLSDIEINDGNPVNVELQNVWGYRAATELKLPEWQMGKAGASHVVTRGGFGYEPSPLVAQGASTALLDADRLLFAIGVGLTHGAPWGLVEGPITWDAFYQHHILATGTLERPEISEPQPGYPVGNAEIPIGGRLVAAGLQWSFDY